jgi:hypothetical protein
MENREARAVHFTAVVTVTIQSRCSLLHYLKKKQNNIFNKAQIQCYLLNQRYNLHLMQATQVHVPAYS